MNTCTFCGKQISQKGSLVSHQKRCNSNPNKVTWKTGCKPGQGWNRGKKLQELFDTQQCQRIKRIVSQKGKLHKGYASTPEKQKLRRQHLSETRKRLGLTGGYRIGSGRSKGSWYQSPIAGRVYLDSTWQLAYARWLDQNKVLWRRNKIKFPYKYEGIDCYYIPDFYLEEADQYIQIKGYETQRDRAKWKYFPYKLKVLKKTELKQMLII